MATRKEKENVNKKVTNDFLCEILKRINFIEEKMEESNVLMKELTKVCDKSSSPFASDETHVKSVMTSSLDEEQILYQSPTEIIQREVNELSLQKEATKIKQKMRAEWCKKLNSRKQLYWKQINNSNDAEQYEKWLNQENATLPRKYRITSIRGEPEEQTQIRVNVAVERVKGEIELLRMRSGISKQKVANIDEQMIVDLKTKATGRVLEILLSMWKLDCEKEEKKSVDRWRYKEIWLLDYVRKYGNSCIKENAPKQVKRNENTNKPKPTYQSKPSKLSYAEITSKSQDAPEVLENNAQTSLFPPQIADPNNRRNTKNNQHHGRKSPFERNSNANRNTFYQPLIRKPVGKRQFPQNRYNGQNNGNSYHSSGNLLRRNGTTYIGRKANHYFLGGGKPSQGQRYPNNRYLQGQRTGRK